MKKILVLILTLALLAVAVIPAAAAGHGPGGGNGGGNGNGSGIFAMAGTIAAVDSMNQAVTVKAVTGNKLVQPFIGQEVRLQTTTTTRFLLRNADGTCTAISFADLKTGQNVSVNGKLAGDVWTAQRITVGALLTGQP